MRSVAKSFLSHLTQTCELDIWSVKQRLLADCKQVTNSSVRHVETSALLSMDDSPGAPTDWLMDVAESALHRARSVDLHFLDERGVPELVHVWPGEHYRFLAAIVSHLEAQTVVEVGTFTGLSALAILHALPKGGKLVTFDIIPWQQIPKAYLRESDFDGARLTQVVADLGDGPTIARHAELLRRADLIFIDGPKNRTFEMRLLQHLCELGLKPKTLLIFDDIRLWNMLAIWRQISHPKLDLTSFGHWSGTGLVEWT